MEIFLTDEELSRERHLFAPHEDAYPPLEGREEELRSLKERLTESDDLPKELPSSC